MTDQTPHTIPPQLPATAVSPTSTGGPSKRRGLPRWAWALMIAGGLVFIGVVTTLIVTASFVFSAATASGCAVESCGPEAATSTNDASASSRAPVADGSDRIPLDALAVFDGQPVWASQLAPSWRMVTLDDNGVNVFQDGETGCVLLTSQTVASNMADSTTDSTPSEEMVDATIATYAAKDPGMSVLDRGSIDITLAASSKESTIEFAAGTVFRTSPAGDPQAVEIIARSMPDSGTSLVATMTCNPEVHAAAGAPYGELVTALAVVINP